MKRSMSGGSTMFLVLAIFFSLPFYAFLIWSIKEPVEAQLLFDRWRYKEPPSYSEKQITLFKIGNVFGIIALTLFLISYGLSF